MRFSRMQDIFAELFIPFVILLVIGLSVFGEYYDKNKKEKIDPMEYLYDIADLESSSKSEYGMYPEDAISIFEQYLFGDKWDREEITEEDLESAFYLLSDYYKEASAIARKATK